MSTGTWVIWNTIPTMAHQPTQVIFGIIVLRTWTHSPWKLFPPQRKSNLTQLWSKNLAMATSWKWSHKTKLGPNTSGWCYELLPMTETETSLPMTQCFTDYWVLKELLLSTPKDTSIGSHFLRIETVGSVGSVESCSGMQNCEFVEAVVIRNQQSAWPNLAFFEFQFVESKLRHTDGCRGRHMSSSCSSGCQHSNIDRYACPATCGSRFLHAPYELELLYGIPRDSHHGHDG